MPRRASRSCAFTLLEMLVALAVFAVIGVMASRILAGMVDLAAVVGSRGEALAELQRAVAIVERDIEQAARRAVRDEWGDTGDAIGIDGDHLLELTRRGWQNPLAEPRSELQRIAYALREGALLRVYWPVLDRAPDTEPMTQMLLAGVADARFVIHDSGGDEHQRWPRAATGDDDERHVEAIALQLDSTTFGRIERLWLLPPPAGDPSPREQAEQPDDDAPPPTPERDS